MQQISDFSTYRTGILQARAYRNLRFFMSRTLKSYELSSVEWSLLGVVSEETKNGGIRVGDLAKLLDVEPSFITNTTKKLMKNGYVKYGYDEDDGRVRLLMGTDSGHLKVIEIEQSLRKEMRQWLGNVEMDELVIYIRVLNKIAGKSVE